MEIVPSTKRWVMYAINGSCVSLERSKPIAPQIEGILELISGDGDRLSVAREISYSLNWSGVRTVISEGVFYDFWKAIVLLEGFSLQEFVFMSDQPLFLFETWAEDKNAPDGGLRRSALTLALKLTFKNLKESQTDGVL